MLIKRIIFICIADVYKYIISITLVILWCHTSPTILFKGVFIIKETNRQNMCLGHASIFTKTLEFSVSLQTDLYRTILIESRLAWTIWPNYNPTKPYAYLPPHYVLSVLISWILLSLDAYILICGGKFKIKTLSIIIHGSILCDFLLLYAVFW